MFNGIALYRLHADQTRCTHCGVCARTCKMAVDPSRAPNSPECIRCGDCLRACPHSALTLSIPSARFSIAPSKERGGSTPRESVPRARLH
jgi:ferredoxin